MPNEVEIIEVYDTQVEVVEVLDRGPIGPQGPAGPSPDLSSPPPIGDVTPNTIFGTDIQANNFSFNTAAGAVAGIGEMVWNDTDGTIDLGLKGGNATLQLGQELVLYVKNDDTVQLTDGMVVYVSGANGANLLVKRAQANAELTSAATIGVVTEPIATNGHGYITTFGNVRGINTNSFNAGDILYLSPTTAGLLTNVKPTAPEHMVVVGFVVKKSAGQGEIFVQVQNGYELGELHDVSISSVAAGQVVRRNSGNTLWENHTLTPSDIGAATAAQGALADTAVQPNTGPSFTGIDVVSDTPMVVVESNSSGKSTAIKDGRIEFSATGNDYVHTLQHGTISAHATFTLPTSTGTLALTSQIPSTFAASAITSGTLDTARLGSGTASASTYLRGDSTWATTFNPAAPGAIGGTTAAAGTFTSLAATGLSLSAGTLTASTPFDFSQTWNNSAVTFTGLKFNVTNTNSAAASLLMDLQVGGTSVAKINKSGTLTATSISASGGSSFFASLSASNLYVTTSGKVAVGSTGLVGFAATGDATGTLDTTLYRDAANTLAQRNGANAQTFRLYNTYTDASNYERGFLRWSINVLQLGTEKLGTGAARALELHVDGTVRMALSTNAAYPVAFYGDSTSCQIPIRTNALVGCLKATNSPSGYGFGDSSYAYTLFIGSGKVGIANTAPTEYLDVNSDAIRVRTARTPASATATGNAGTVCWDSSYIYVCTATNTWVRAALSTWP